MKSLLLLACLCAPAVFPQDPAAAMEQALAKQRASVEKQQESFARQRDSFEKQKVSVRRQVASPVKVQQLPPQDGAQPSEPMPEIPSVTIPTDSFFTVDWGKPLISRTMAPACDPVPSQQISSIVSDVSRREGLTPDLLRAVIEKESSYFPCALSSKGAQGLMQLMPGTAAELGVGDAFDPRENVEGGARYLKQLLLRYSGSLPLALAAYNAGPTRVDQAGGVPLIPETVNYVNQILGKLPVE